MGEPASMRVRILDAESSCDAASDMCPTAGSMVLVQILICMGSGEERSIMACSQVKEKLGIVMDDQSSGRQSAAERQ